MSGWGACMGTQMIQGFCSNSQKTLHINCLDNEEVFLVLKKWYIWSKEKSSDSIRQCLSSTVYQQTRGNQVSFPVYTRLESVAVCHTEQNLIKSSSYWRQIENCPRSVESSRNKANRMEPSSDHNTSHLQLIIDLFASFYNRKETNLFMYSSSIDVLIISWERMFAYAFPHICLIPRVLQHMK
jgi:hypothetical protein